VTLAAVALLKHSSPLCPILVCFLRRLDVADERLMETTRFPDSPSDTDHTPTTSYHIIRNEVFRGNSVESSPAPLSECVDGDDSTRRCTVARPFSSSEKVLGRRVV